MADRHAIGEHDRSREGRGRTALVTGASSGIGRAMAELLGAKGYTVLPLARREGRLADLAGELRARWQVEAEPVVADLEDPATPARVAAELASRGRQVDVLVNNAGNSRIGRFDTLPWADHARRIQLMGLATLELTHSVLPGMVERGWGRIINVASIGGLFTGFPDDVVYGSLKAMAGQFSEGIDAEYRELGVRSTVTFPGPTATEIFTVPGSAADVFADSVYSRAVMRPETVARDAYRAVMEGHPSLVPGRHYQALAIALTHTPKRVRRGLSQALCRRMEPAK